MTIDFETATRLAQAELDHEGLTARGFVLDMDRVTDEGWCWVFPYNTLRVLQATTPVPLPGGNAPFVVVKESGILHKTGTAHELPYYLRDIRDSAP